MKTLRSVASQLHKQLYKFVIRSIVASALTIALAVPISAILFGQVAEAANNQAPLHAQAAQDTAAPVNSLADVRQAVVRIETIGSFWYRSSGGPSQRGTGSGFIINEQGLAVTNNHVVAGASSLRIWIDGEAGPRSARILGVAECSDLAIIDIDGDGFSYLDWYQNDVATQLPVHAAGFPYGTPDFTLTSGNVSNTQARGDSSWSSISSVIEHSASISPGDSGGPLVDDQGRVVAVNYLRSRRTGLSYAISQQEAAPILEALSSGQSVNSIGISGESVALTDDAVAVWISAVTPDSPAAALGLQPGDIIWNLDGSFLDPNSLMIDYCDTLKRNPNGRTIQLEIYRSTSGEFLSGQINGQALRVINPPTDEAISVSPDPVGGSTTAPEVAESSQAVSGAYILTPPSAWTITNEGSQNTAAGIEVEIELGSSAGSNLLISAVGSEDVRFVRIDSVHGGVRQSLVERGLVTSCPSVADSTAAYGAYEMTYSRWSGCTNANEVYVMTAKSRTAPYHMVGLVGSFAAADNGYDVLLRTLGGLQIDNPRPRTALAPRQASPGQVAQPSGSAVVIADVLNVRRGPGLENTVIGQVFQGDGLTVLAQFNSCGWFQVVTPTGARGWVSGDRAYVGLVGQCGVIPSGR